MQEIDRFAAWDCRSCAFHNAFSVWRCGKCSVPRDLFFMCLGCLQFRLLLFREEDSKIREPRPVDCLSCFWKGHTNKFFVSTDSSSSAETKSVAPPPPPPQTNAARETRGSKRVKRESKQRGWSQDQLSQAIALSLSLSEEEKQRPSAPSVDLLHWDAKKDQKQWCFEERHAEVFPSLECPSCHYPNRGSKVNPLYLNNWRQRRLICVSCKKEREGHWTCPKGHRNVLVAAIQGLTERPPNAHTCSKCNEQTRSIRIEYSNGDIFEEEVVEEGWALSLSQL